MPERVHDPLALARKGHIALGANVQYYDAVIDAYEVELARAAQINANLIAKVAEQSGIIGALTQELKEAKGVTQNG